LADLDKEDGECWEKMGSPTENEPAGLEHDHRDKVVAAGSMVQVFRLAFPDFDLMTIL
jgi:hypothetical protein